MTNLPIQEDQIETSATRSFRPVKLSLLALIFAFAALSTFSLYYFRFKNITPATDPTILVTDLVGEGAGFALLCGINDLQLTPPKAQAPGYPYSLHPSWPGGPAPVGAQFCYSYPRLLADGVTNDFSFWEKGYCNLETKSCSGPKVLKTVCDVPNDIDWSLVQGKTGFGTARQCHTGTGINDASVFKYVAGSRESVTNGSLSVGNVPCGKIVQLDVLFEDPTRYQGDKWYDYFVYYTGKCPAPTPTPTPTPTPSPSVTPTPNATISCESLTGVAKALDGREIPLSSVPNDFEGEAVFTCTGKSTVSPITSVTFTLVKRVNGVVVDEKSITRKKIDVINNSGGVKTYSTNAGFNIDGAGDYKVTSVVCNSENLCSP